ncbi:MULTISPECIES: DUF6286 domain-containing protein [Streptomyces]|uniref:DUF6286 domain-containing protein n=1 Tax=Streptomyces dengpaensis TaxID=2049881 RepID=A0ABM6SY90_9ACTN|nr:MULTISPECIES: DUF6286 domain-containing protein [Streptomyces]AVH59484.1 hypothetical protein C4B68_31225 [Streptomyces dengpaensis]PIB05841.1 hypothetical protein B1C81_27505 [Streptomyces sp. HG99]
MSEPQGSESTRPTSGMPVLEKSAQSALGQSTSSAGYEPLHTVDDEDGGQGRFWSARRIPAGILAVLILVVAGAFLYDVSAVRADRPAMHWRRALARQLAERPLDDTWVLVGAGVAAALGIWLLVLAATPGLREILPMRRTHADVRAGLHRGAAAMTLRDRAMEVAGVQSVRVRVGRRKVDVRAVSHFRELDDVRADLDATVADGIRGLGLTRSLSMSVHVRRPGRKG